MEINTNSWHYKFIKTLKVDKPKTLCGYIGTIFSGVFIYSALIFMGYFISFLLGMTVSVVRFPEYQFYLTFLTYPVIGIITILLAFLCTALFIVALMSLVMAIVIISEKISKTVFWTKVSNTFKRYCSPVSYKDKP